MSWSLFSAASPPAPCVAASMCRSWNRLISESKYHKKLPQIVVGLLYGTWKRQTLIRLLHLWISLLFLLALYHSGFSRLRLLQRPHPLLSAIRWLANQWYCRITTFVMVQLAWSSIRQSPRTSNVVELWLRSPGVLVVSIYSSKTRAWMCKENMNGERYSSIQFFKNCVS
jgi:hypothetical protein